MEPRHKSHHKAHHPKLLGIVVVPPVEGRTGEVQVTLTNDSSRHLEARVMRVREITGGGSRRFAVIPSEEDGGYRVPRVPPHETLTRTFCLRPVEAEVGSETNFEARVEIEGVSDVTDVFQVHVLARPEIYAAIGAVEWLRENLLSTYERFEQKGRDRQERLGLTWPSAEPLDSARVALGEETFNKVFEAIQLGARIVDGIARKSGGGSS